MLKLENHHLISGIPHSAETKNKIRSALTRTIYFRRNSKKNERIETTARNAALIKRNIKIIIDDAGFKPVFSRHPGCWDSNPNCHFIRVETLYRFNFYRYKMLAEKWVVRNAMDLYMCDKMNLSNHPIATTITL